jgi:peptidoglycan/xylan/chitin deacetylase (PgdA/CDA1 family)
MIPTIMGRRRFFGKSLLAATGMLAALPRRAQAQNPASGVQASGRYDDTMIFERKPFTWPGGKTLAVWVAPNVEVWAFDSSADAARNPAGPPVPDTLNYGTREYGIRVGLWRIAEVLDEARVKATVALNSAVCDIYPRAVEEMKKRDWEFMGHGITISRSLSGLSIDQERDVIRASIQTIEKATGKRVRGWLSPGQLETANTPDLLGEAGILYTCDWNNDDQPYRMKVKTGELYSLPYHLAINDTDHYQRLALTGPQYLESVVAQFDMLAGESQKQPRVLGLPIHPFLTGVPAHIKYFKQAIQHIRESNRVWFATGAEIVEAYRKAQS